MLGMILSSPIESDLMLLDMMQIIINIYFAGFLTCLAEILAGCLILPRLARQDLRRTGSLLIRVQPACLCSLHASAFLFYFAVHGTSLCDTKYTCLQCILQGIGHSISAYASHVCRPDPPADGSDSETEDTVEFVESPESTPHTSKKGVHSDETASFRNTRKVICCNSTVVSSLCIVTG
jgi:hypothetical protein